MSKSNADLALVVTEKTRIALEKKLEELSEDIKSAKLEQEKSEKAVLAAVMPHAEAFAKKVNDKLKGVIRKRLVIAEESFRNKGIRFYDFDVNVFLAHEGSPAYVALDARFPINTLPQRICEMIKDTKVIIDRHAELDQLHSKIRRSIYDNGLAKTIRLSLAEARLAKESVDVDAMVSKMLKRILGDD